jgi:uncharacterized damage-inducible protein DinB
MTPDDNGAALVRTLTDSRHRLLGTINGVSDADLRRRPADDEWSMIEVLAHLADVEAHWLGQALAIRDDPEHLFVHFDDERWKREHPAVRDEPPAQVLARVERAHRAVLETLAGLTPHDLDRAGRHPRGAPYTVREVFRRYAAHDENHTAQLAAIRARLGA